MTDKELRLRILIRTLKFIASLLDAWLKGEKV